MAHNVMLVDDDADILRCLRRMLQDQPYDLYAACSGEEALSVLNCRPVDVIVVDERMPGMSGTELLKRIVKHYPEVVRLMLTGHASAETLIRAVNEGGVYYVLTKPCNEAHLAIMIRKALEHRDLLAENSQLRNSSRQEARDRQQFAKNLEVLRHAISRDVKKPLRLVAQSCQSLLEQYPDVFDPKAKSAMEAALEAISDMQSLVEELLVGVTE